MSKNKNHSPFLVSRIKEAVCMGALALILFGVAWVVFQEGEDSQNLATAQMSNLEQKVSRILQEIDGVGEASVIVCEEEDEVKSVVVVCEGANDLRVVMDIREAVSTALNTEQKSVKIYLKKD